MRRKNKLMMRKMHKNYMIITVWAAIMATLVVLFKVMV